MSNTILGLDIGTNSLGWALLKQNKAGHIVGITAIGSRIFEAGMDGDIASGHAESKAKNRTEKRAIRRSLARKRRRMEKLKSALQRNDFLPPENDFHKNLEEFDKQLIKQYLSAKGGELPSPGALPHILPFYIRARALDKKLSPHEFGRAIYHLAQRRGFQSNRKEISKEDEGVVKQGISELLEKIKHSGARTLGEYFAYIDPMKERIRGLWTSRDMYIDEFNKICDAQSDLLSPELRKYLYNSIFFQRKLRSQKHLIGRCALEKGQKRCPWYRIEAQTFRILQTINNLRVKNSDEPERELSTQEWSLLRKILEGSSGELDRSGNITFAKVKKLLCLPRSSKFSIEEGGEKSIKGNVINAKLYNIFGERWNDFSDMERENALMDIHSFEKDNALIRRAQGYWKLSKEKAKELAAIKLPDDYCNLSLKAIYKLLPDMEEGISYSEAVKKHYPEQFAANDKILDSLPQVSEFNDELRNPAVHRCLSETRKIVNSIIAEYGKPDVIRIELARALKKSNKEKKRIIQKNRDNEKLREEAKRKIFDELKIENPSRDDILKILLAEESGWKCPYTQKSISINSLIVEPQFDIEHIIPFSRSLDNSFVNKTLCYHEENRNIKRNMTPYEAYCGDSDKYNLILSSVKRFTGGLADEKLRRFKLADISEFEDFSSRHLNDTRFASKSVMKFLGALYGGIYDTKGKRRVQALSGGITALIRSVLGLNDILGNGIKNRNDHRHHAVDAIAIAVTSPKIVQKLTNILKNMEKKQSDRFRLELKDSLTFNNWPDFRQDAFKAVNDIIISHYVSKKARGPFHEETIYSKSHKEKDKNNKYAEFKYVRKQLADLALKNVDEIVDHAVRKAVSSKLEELGEKNLKKAFSKPENLPVLKNGHIVKRVKIRKKQETITVGKKDRARNVVLGNNHHMEIVAILDNKGNEIKWEGHVVSLFEARQRIKNKKPIVNKDFGTGKVFKFSLTRGDIVKLTENDGSEVFRIIRDVPQSKQLSFVALNDARKKKDIIEAKEWYTGYPNSLMKKSCKKYSITPLGTLRRAND